jgi:tetratricopeptide (TPR) repeat protein
MIHHPHHNQPPTRHTRACSLSLGLFLGLLLAITSTAQADQVVLNTGPVDATVSSFKDDKLTYIDRRNNSTERTYDKILEITLDNETAFNAAEKAFVAKKPADAIDNYVKTIRGTDKPWLKTFAARRLFDALGKNGRFDAHLTAYLAYLQTEPERAADHKPTLPDKGSKLLDTAVTEIEAATRQTNLSEAQSLALFNFLIEVQRQRGDEAAVAAIVERMLKTSNAAANDPVVKAQLAGLKVNQAKLALDQKNYTEAARLVNENRSFIIDRSIQSDALFILATAHFASVNKADKTALTDAALMFMRVVAHSSDLEDMPNVAASLAQTAGILALTGDKPAALSLNQQIIRDFPNTTAAKQAADQIEALNKSSE